MARLSSFSFMMFLLLDIIAMISPSLANAPYNDLDDVPVDMPPPEPSQNFYKFWIQCLQKITPKCGEEVITTIFENGTVTNECCDQLVMMFGRTCEDTLVRYVAQEPKFKAHEHDYLIKSQQEWNQCVSGLAEAPSPA